jgi:NADPH:quinone reductase-like Zn-dependent oxidoreductase
MPADRLVVLPDGISDQQAAVMMLKGMTARYLIRQTYKVKEGDTILFHAAAGGVGLIACQWVKALGATVIGTVGSDEKAELAKAHGCDHPIVYTRENFVEADSDRDRKVGIALVEDTGFYAFDAGTLAESWRQQPGAPGYCTDFTREEMPAALAAADRARLPK